MDTPNTILVTCSRLAELGHPEVTALETADACARTREASSFEASELGNDISPCIHMRQAIYCDLTDEDGFPGLAPDATATALVWIGHGQLQKTHRELADVL